MGLPIYLTSDRQVNTMQSNWASILNPLLNNEIVNNNFITAKLAIGSNTINTLLSRKLQGWVIVGMDAPSTIYDLQATNQNPNQTLILHSSAVCNVKLLVF